MLPGALVRGLEHRLRQAVRDQLVRVVLAHQAAIGERDVASLVLARDAQHLVRVGSARSCSSPHAGAAPSRPAVRPRMRSIASSARELERRDAERRGTCARRRPRPVRCSPPPCSAASSWICTNRRRRSALTAREPRATRSSVASSGKSACLPAREDIRSRAADRLRPARSAASPARAASISCSVTRPSALGDVAHDLEGRAEERSAQFGAGRQHALRARRPGPAALARRVELVSEHEADDRAEQAAADDRSRGSRR